MQYVDITCINIDIELKLTMIIDLLVWLWILDDVAPVSNQILVFVGNICLNIWCAIHWHWSYWYWYWIDMIIYRLVWLWILDAPSVSNQTFIHNIFGCNIQCAIYWHCSYWYWIDIDNDHILACLALNIRCFLCFQPNISLTVFF